MTPDTRIGSHNLGWILLVILPACTSPAEARPTSQPGPESRLGVADTGIFSDLDEKVQLTLPPELAPERVSATIDRPRALLVLSIDDFPRKVYPLGGPTTLAVGRFALALRAGDAAELRPLLREDRITEGAAKRDRDNDGIPDALDILIGAKKTVANAAAYTAEAQGYIKLKYPGGDVDRSMGVCTDVVIRALRNAGIDLQRAVHEDIKKRRAAFPMVKKGPDSNIDHRRVGTLLPYFKKHWQQRTAKLDDPADPLRPGDIIFMDTFPSRAGPDHIGIVSDRFGDNGLPLVINNWTNGTVTSEMDLLPSVPVLYRFRSPP